MTGCVFRPFLKLETLGFFMQSNRVLRYFRILWYNRNRFSFRYVVVLFFWFLLPRSCWNCKSHRDGVSFQAGAAFVAWPTIENCHIQDHAIGWKVCQAEPAARPTSMFNHRRKETKATRTKLLPKRRFGPPYGPGDSHRHQFSLDKENWMHNSGRDEGPFGSGAPFLGWKHKPR